VHTQGPLLLQSLPQQFSLAEVLLSLEVAHLLSLSLHDPHEPQLYMAAPPIASANIEITMMIYDFFIILFFKKYIKL
jgi:hypothetical protein